MWKVIVLGVLVMMGGCNKYPSWEYVRIEHVVPDKSCIYKVQEACSEQGGECMNWYKQRATKYNANTVVITDGDKDQIASRSGFTGNYNEDVRRMFMAEYYLCNTSKNITPPNKN